MQIGYRSAIVYRQACGQQQRKKKVAYQAVVTFEDIVQRMGNMWLSPGDFTQQLNGSALKRALFAHYEDLAQQLGCSLEEVAWWFRIPYRVGNDSLCARGFGPRSIDDGATGAQHMQQLLNCPSS